MIVPPSSSTYSVSFATIGGRLTLSGSSVIILAEPSPTLAVLRTRKLANGAPRDSLVNSTVLALMQTIAEHEGLADLRTLLLSTHRQELEALHHVQHQQKQLQ